MTVKRHVLWLKQQPPTADERRYRAAHPRDAAHTLKNSDDILVVVIGPTVAEPLSLAQHISPALDEAMELLIICTPDRVEAMRRSLKLTPFVGPHAHAVSDDEQLHDQIASAVERARRRRRHRDVVRRARSAMDDEPAAPHPSYPGQYARALWSAAPIGLLAVSLPSRHVVNANEAATDLLQTREIDIIGQRLEQLFDTDADRWNWVNKTERDIQPGDTLTCRLSQTRKTHLQLRATSVSDSDPNIVLLLFWDITDRVQYAELQQQLIDTERAARHKAEEASRIRENALAAVAHDLRSPLTTLMTAAQVLDNLGDDNGAAVPVDQLAGSITRATRFMSGMVDDLVEIARIEGGRLNLDCQQIAAGELVADSVALVEADARVRGVTIETPTVDQSAVIYGDRTRLMQLLKNLISNAVKFSPNDQTVDVCAQRLDRDVRLSVIDRGPGIPEDEIPHLFEHFWQRDRSDSRGLGLGLAIVRGIVDAHHGRICVDSIVSEGTSFHVDLPPAPPDDGG